MSIAATCDCGKNPYYCAGECPKSNILPFIPTTESATHEREYDQVTRVEIINYAHPVPYARAYTYYLKDGESIELDYQDGGRTLKIFINKAI